MQRLLPSSSEYDPEEPRNNWIWFWFWIWFIRYMFIPTLLFLPITFIQQDFFTGPNIHDMFALSMSLQLIFCCKLFTTYVIFMSWFFIFEWFIQVHQLLFMYIPTFKPKITFAIRKISALFILRMCFLPVVHRVTISINLQVASVAPFIITEKFLFVPYIRTWLVCGKL